MLYSKIVLDHFRKPHNLGNLKNPTVVGEAGNPTCGDMMKLYLEIKKKGKGKDLKKDVIKNIKFETLGCAAAIAVSSVFTDLIKGKTLEKAKSVKAKDIAKALGGLPPVKFHCSMLVTKALEEALKKYD